MRTAASEPGRRANDATGVIRRCADVSWRITASGYSPYAASKPTQPHAVMRPAAPASGRRANNATGVIRRCADVSWRITASGYSPYAASEPIQPHAVMRTAASEPIQPHAVMRTAASEPGRRANDATGVIRRCAGVSWRITASGYSPYAASEPTQPHAVMRPARTRSPAQTMFGVGRRSRMPGAIRRSPVADPCRARPVDRRVRRIRARRTGSARRHR